MTERQQSEAHCVYPKGFVRPCILLLLEEGAAHGYELVERLKPFGPELSSPSPVYRCLHALEEAELVRCQWDTDGPGPARRVYELTSAGRRALESDAADLRALVDKVLDYLVRYRRLGRASGSVQRRSFRVLVEATLSVDAPDEETARKTVERALAKPCRLHEDVWSAGPAWVYEATAEADA
ncbi:MAG TPA: helix-turn-helix transcriptional regulator [Acidimicrobiales bacterium]|nr:helix-turn-helix transcriptional regulator [Acidimicrobiales bacterium]